jgi:hypothetical protein
MAISEAKLEANRRNAMRSCGPRTQSGKDRSKLNAVKHGMRAATLVLLDEDAQALEDRKAEWAASLMPRGAAEERIVEDSVEYSWLRDRVRRAQEARLATNIVNAGVDENMREADEVLRLGQKLFSDNRGPLANYPHYDREQDGYPESVSLVSHSEIVDGDPEDPQRLVLHLQATAGGCQWMLDRWSELRSILEEGLDWQSADKLKAIRLLGRHPIEAVDDRTVLMVFVACQAIEGRAGKLIPEIWNELRKYERKQYAERLIGRGIEKLTPTDAAAARQALYAIIDRATAQIARKAEAHRVRSEINDSLTADRLAFDDSPEGERLRRFDLACGRGLARSLDSLLKLRRAPELVDCPSPDLAGSLSAAGDTLESSAALNATNEATEASENVTNELSWRRGGTQPHENGVGLFYAWQCPALGLRPSVCLVLLARERTWSRPRLDIMSNPTLLPPGLRESTKSKLLYASRSSHRSGQLSQGSDYDGYHSCLLRRLGRSQEDGRRLCPQCRPRWCCQQRGPYVWHDDPRVVSPFRLAGGPRRWPSRDGIDRGLLEADLQSAGRQFRGDSG